jgi:diaminopimelate epimerase
MKFYKYHALGNDYLVLRPEDFPEGLTPERIRRICHRNYGIGSDGILLGPFKTPDGTLRIEIFNPDGGEAEKSGNGLRIFSRYLFDIGAVGDRPFTLLTAGGPVGSRVMDGGQRVEIEMGRVSFHSTEIPVEGPPREVLRETITVAGADLLFCAATIGNPHCVVLRDAISPEDACKWGPGIERHPLFPNRTNVQFMKVLDRSSIRIEIWERGAGYTLASGSSSSAAAAVAHRLGLCDDRIAVHMPGGKIDIRVREEYDIVMTGPVTRVAEGTLSREMFPDTPESQP